MSTAGEGDPGTFAKLRSARRKLADPAGENRLARFVAMNVLGSGASLAFGFLASILLARFLGPSGRGLLGLMSSTSGLALVLAGLGFPTAVTYFASLEGADQRAILGNTILVAAGMTAVVVPVSWIFHDEIASAFGHGSGGTLWALAAVLVPLTLLDYCVNSQLQGSLRFARFNVNVVASRLVYLVAVVVLVGVTGSGVKGGLVALAVGELMMVLTGLPPVLRDGLPRASRAMMGRMLAYGLRAEVGSILQFANGRLDVLVLQVYRPLAQAGYYLVAQAVAELVLVIAKEFRWTNMVLVTKSEGLAEQEETSSDAIRHYGIVAASVVLAVAAIGVLLIRFAYGPQFVRATVPMLILLPGTWFLGMGIVVQGDLSGRGRPGLSSLMALLSAAVTVALDLLLIPPLGVTGAALASVCAYATFGIASLVALHRVSGIPIRRMVVPTSSDLRGYALFLKHTVARLGR